MKKIFIGLTLLASMSSLASAEETSADLKEMMNISEALVGSYNLIGTKDCGSFSISKRKIGNRELIEVVIPGKHRRINIFDGMTHKHFRDNYGFLEVSGTGMSYQLEALSKDAAGTLSNYYTDLDIELSDNGELDSIRISKTNSFTLNPLGFIQRNLNREVFDCHKLGK